MDWRFVVAAVLAVIVAVGILAVGLIRGAAETQRETEE